VHVDTDCDLKNLYVVPPDAETVEQPEDHWSADITISTNSKPSVEGKMFQCDIGANRLMRGRCFRLRFDLVLWWPDLYRLPLFSVGHWLCHCDEGPEGEFIYPCEYDGLDPDFPLRRTAKLNLIARARCAGVVCGGRRIEAGVLSTAEGATA
jgi:hypothetical protein